MDNSLPNITTFNSCDDLWHGIKVASYHVQASAQIRNQQAVGHRVVLNAGGPVHVRWKGANSWQEKTYQTGAMGIVPHGEYNDVVWEGALYATTMAIDPLFADQIFEINNICITAQRGVCDPTAYQLVSLLGNELKHEHLAGKIFGESVALAFTTHLVTNYAGHRKKVSAPKGKLSARQLKNVIEYCNDMIGGPIGLDDMSSKACLSVFHFARLFKRSVGCTPHQYLLRLKIEKATQLLNSHRLTISEIAHQLSFSDQAHFCNAFKKSTGYSPKMRFNIQQDFTSF